MFLTSQTSQVSSVVSGKTLRAHKPIQLGGRQTFEGRPRVGFGELCDPVSAGVSHYGTGPGHRRGNNRVHAQIGRQRNSRLQRYPWSEVAKPGLSKVRKAAQ